MNAVDILLEKASQNLEIAEIALNKEYFDVAVSRYYYSLYQKIIWLLRKKYPDYNSYKDNGKGSHENTFIDITKYLARNFHKKLEIKECGYLSQLNNLTQDVKRYRHTADYDPRKITDDEFNKEFKNKYKSIEILLDKVISLIQIREVK